MKQRLAITSALLIASLSLAGCSSTETDPLAPNASQSPANPESSQAEELTPALDNTEIDIEQRSLVDINKLNGVTDLSIAEAYENGFVQLESTGGIPTATVFDPKRDKEKRSLMWFGGEGEPVYTPVPEVMLDAYSGNGGIFRLDLLKAEIASIKNILTYDLPKQGDIVPSAEAYESLLEGTTYTFISPMLSSEVVVVVGSDGLIKTITETLEGEEYKYTFEYSTTKYQEFFNELFN